jgi:hypothetical protein
MSTNLKLILFSIGFILSVVFIIRGRNQKSENGTIDKRYRYLLPVLFLALIIRQYYKLGLEE